MPNASGNADRLYVGIDVGSVSLNCVAITAERQIVYEHPYTRHLGKVETCTAAVIEHLCRTFGRERIESIAFTGNHGSAFSRKADAFYEFETISQVLGVLHLCPEVQTIISMGGQETALFQIRHGDGHWELDFFNTNGPCASGTGSFIDQQAQRLATSIYSRTVDAAGIDIDRILADFIQLGLQSEKPANVACRCTVFTKSDMIHLQNKGERLEDIIHGLHVGNASNYLSTMVSNRMLAPPVLFIGGLSLNTLQVKAFKRHIPEITVPPHSTSLGALGVALQSIDAVQAPRPNWECLLSSGEREKISVPTATPLQLRATAFSDRNDLPPRILRERTPTYLGIDIGSTSTKYALINTEAEIIHKNYLPTQGKPIEVTQRLLALLRREMGARIDILGTAATGSGRNVVGDFLNVDLIIDEITAHARGAVHINSAVDTIFEIGGQDAKYISIVNTHPLDFDMNKVCAAGTGSFLHELANKYGINIVGEFQEIALSSKTPVKLAERCTVFMESDLVSYLQQGVPQIDLIAGLCYAIVHNYLNRVVGKRKIGRTIMFLGGPSLNKAIVAAFENVLGRGLLVPPHREVLGAFGAALGVRSQMKRDRPSQSTFRGLESAIKDRMQYKETICRADAQCQNQCKLKIYDFGGRRSIWGGECGRYEMSKGRRAKGVNHFEAREKIWLSYMDGMHATLQGEPLLEVDGRPTIGMQRALYSLQTGVLWAHFFDRLGLRLVLTPPTNTGISRAGIETMVAETCYPIKVSHGHVKSLIGMTRYLFLPTLIDMHTPAPEETGFFCPLVQSNAYMARMALGLEPAAAGVLSPVLHLKNDPDTLTLELAKQLGGPLGVSRSAVRQALSHALQMQARFVGDLHQRGHQVLENHDPRTPLIIVTGRPYNLYDERLNLRLGQNMAKIGLSGLPMDFVDVSAIDLSDFPSMYWGLGAQILRTAKFIRSKPNYFGLHLTNFSCGPDSFLEHFYKHVMADNPYLILELDEHSAVAGVMTRLEAYANVLDNTLKKKQAALERDLKAAY